jgi:hypothetical protein
MGVPGARIFYLCYRTRLSYPACKDDHIDIVISIRESTGLVTVTYCNVPSCAYLRGLQATLGFQTAGPSPQAITIGARAPVLDAGAARQSMSFQPPR